MPAATSGGDRGTFLTRPLTTATWPDLDHLFKLRGGAAVRSCWCMYYRTTGQSL